MSQPRVLELGMHGEDVAEWQDKIGAKVDGDFGPETDKLTRMVQLTKGLVVDGKVGPQTRAAIAATVPPPAPFSAEPAAFIPARYFGSRHGFPISVLVVHTAETGEAKKSARGSAGWFNSEMRAKDGKIYEASAHYCVDADEIIQCVRDHEMAFGAPYANRNGLHIEHAGRASQTPEQWSDAYSDAMLRRSAVLVAALCRKHGIPIKRIGPDELKAGGRGICGHDTVSKAFPVKGAHTDPGPSFPWDRYIGLVMDADGMGDAKPDATA